MSQWELTFEKRFFVLNYLAFFLIMCSYYLLRPLQQGFILDQLGTHILPYVYLVVTLCTFLSNQVYNFFYNRLKLPAFMSGVFLFFASWTWIFYGLMETHVNDKLSSFLFYVLISIYSVTLSSFMWSTSSHFFSPLQQKKFFGLFASSGSLGGMAGSALTPLVIKTWGLSACLPGAMFFLAATFLIYHYAFSLKHKESAPVDPAEKADAVAQDPLKKTAKKSKAWRELQQDFLDLIQDRYSLLICGMMLFMTLAGNTLMDLYLKDIINTNLSDPKEKSLFFSQLYTWWNGLSLFFDFFLVACLQRQKNGLFYALLLLPISGLCASWVFFYPSLWGAGVLSIAFASLRFSFFNTSLALLFAPLNQEQRFKTQGYVHIFVYRLGSGFGSIIAIFMQDVLSLKPLYLGIASIPLVLAWIWLVAWPLRREYNWVSKKIYASE